MYSGAPPATCGGQTTLLGAGPYPGAAGYGSAAAPCCGGEYKWCCLECYPNNNNSDEVIE